MCKNFTLKRVSAIFSLAVGALVVSTMLGGGADAAPPADLPVDITTSSSVAKNETRYTLKLAYKDGYKLNLKAPEHKRLTFKPEGGEKTYTANDFTKGEHDAEISLTLPASQAPPKGMLIVYLCRPDRCQRVKQEVDWSKK